ncbi:MAG: hypothetical protein WCA23_25155, partial [Stellaceae bacterium]
MKLWAVNPGASRAFGSRYKLTLGALTVGALAWTPGPAHAVAIGYTFQDIVNTADPTFNQELG